MLPEDLSWIPDDGVALTRTDLHRIFSNLRALIDGSEDLDPARAYAVDIAVTLAQALERETGD